MTDRPIAPALIRNRTYDEIKLGDSASLSRTLSREDIELFAIMSGDLNPAHVDEEFARSDMYHHVIAHGMWGASLISAVLGTELPGAGTIYLDQSLKFRAPISPGDTVVVTVIVRGKAEMNQVILECRVTTQTGTIAIEGTAVVIAPGEKVSRPRIELPDLRLEQRGLKLRTLISEAQHRLPIRMAVVHPTDAVSLIGAVESAEAGLILPLLIGPPIALRIAAEKAHIAIDRFEIVPADDVGSAAAMAVRLAADGKADALMKGALHTDVLMHAVLTGQPNLTTGRWISHVFVMDVPRYPVPLMVTDAAINIAPNLENKREIIQNAIDLAHALGIATPKVAILSAVETVTPKIKSTIEAAELCKMAGRGQITGAILDGPLAFDNAVSAEAAKTKGIVSEVAGAADILVVPDIEAGNMLAKQLEYLAGAEGAGIVLGARVPIVLTSRADGTLSRMASCAIAVLLSHHRKERVG